MDATTWITLLTAVGTCIGTFVAYAMWRESRSEKAREKRVAEITYVAEPIRAKVTEVETRVHHMDDRLEALISRAVNPLVTQMAQMETKMDVLWSQQKQLALDAARILHQPDPRRSRIDQLLEDFMDDTLTAEGESELRKYLMQIRNWEPGQKLEFPVHPGEQTAAAILLSAMDHAMPSRTGKTLKDGSGYDR